MPLNNRRSETPKKSGQLPAITAMPLGLLQFITSRCSVFQECPNGIASFWRKVD